MGESATVEVPATDNLFTTVTPDIHNIIQVSNYGMLLRLLHVSLYLLRFIENTKNLTTRTQDRSAVN